MSSRYERPLEEFVVGSRRGRGVLGAHVVCLAQDDNQGESPAQTAYTKDTRRRSSVIGNAGFSGARRGVNGPGVWASRSNRDSRRPSAATALIGRSSDARPPGWAT